MEERFGVIGGMGPMASQLFYGMVTEKTAAERDQDHISLLILSDAQMPDRTEGILSGNTKVVRDRLLADAQLLAQSGCKGIAVTCNTAHFYVDQIAEQVPIPFIHMIRETAKETAKSCAGAKAAVLATDGTIQTRLYQEALQAEGVMAYTPSEESQRKVMYLIYDCIKSGRRADRKVWEEVEAELLDAGCQKALLACTELSVLREQEGLSDFYIDPMAVLAEKTIAFMGKELR